MGKLLGKLFGGIMILLLFGYAVGFVATGADLMWFKFWGPKFQSAEREVFEETRSFVRGINQDIVRYRQEYCSAEPGSSERGVMKSTILHRAAEIDPEDLRDDLRTFVENLERGKENPCDF